MTKGEGLSTPVVEGQGHNDLGNDTLERKSLTG